MTHARTFLGPIYVLGLIAQPCLVQTGRAQTGDLARVVSKPVSRTVELPGEFLAFLSVSLHAKVPSYVDRVLVDRGSIVKEKELLVELSAPEWQRKLPKPQSKVQAAEADRLQARLSSQRCQSTYNRSKIAAERLERSRATN